MSDHSISIVPKKTCYPNNEVKAREILEWLISKDIVKANLSDCILSSYEGYAISEGAKQVSLFPDYLPFDRSLNGLEISTDRQVFHAGENGIDECICPNCKKDIAEESWSFLDNWSKGISDNIICPLCQVGTSIQEFKFTPEWGFSDLGFTFWKWPEFKKDFIEEFQDMLQCEISVVYCHI